MSEVARIYSRNLLHKIHVSEEEYKMQVTWRDSSDKCTFIVVDKSLLESYAFDERDEIASMVGDTNLFISTEGDEKVDLFLNFMKY